MASVNVFSSGTETSSMLSGWYGFNEVTGSLAGAKGSVLEERASGFALSLD